MYGALRGVGGGLYYIKKRYIKIKSFPFKVYYIKKKKMFGVIKNIYISVTLLDICM